MNILCHSCTGLILYQNTICMWLYILLYKNSSPLLIECSMENLIFSCTLTLFRWLFRNTCCQSNFLNKDLARYFERLREFFVNLCVLYIFRYIINATIMMTTHLVLVIVLIILIFILFGMCVATILQVKMTKFEILSVLWEWNLTRPYLCSKMAFFKSLEYNWSVVIHTTFSCTVIIETTNQS